MRSRSRGRRSRSRGQQNTSRRRSRSRGRRSRSRGKRTERIRRSRSRGRRSSSRERKRRRSTSGDRRKPRSPVQSRRSRSRDRSRKSRNDKKNNDLPDLRDALKQSGLKDSLLEHFKAWALKSGKEAGFGTCLADAWCLVKHDERSLRETIEREQAEGEDALKILFMRELYSVSFTEFNYFSLFIH